VLKIGNVTWKGKCGRHPKYDPAGEGEGGIRGGCTRCYALLAIHRQHAALMRALREFGPAAERKKPQRTATTLAGAQASLFD
jgi:hypothetical protein